MKYFILIKIFIFFLLSLSLLNASSLSSSKKSIPKMVKYYQEIDQSQILPKEYLTYKLFKKHNYWKAKEIQYEDAQTVIPYIKDEYLQIDQETANGFEILSLKLWEYKVKRPLVCITKNLFFQSSEIFCVSKEKDKWYKVNFMPKDDVSIFLSDDMSIKDLKILKNINMTLYYGISDKNDFIVVAKNINSKEVKNICSKDSSIDIDNRDDYLYYCNHLENRLKPTFTYVFDKNNFKFIKKPFKRVIEIDSLEGLYKKIESKRKKLLERYYNE